MAITPPDSPLGPEHLERIKEGLAAIERGRRQIELAKRAGIDMSAQERELNEAEQRLRAIKEVYFPGQ